LVAVQVAPFEYSRIRRDKVSGNQFGDIAGDELVDGD
jgi:hypothetical protein